MSSVALMQKFQSEVELIPVPGIASLHTINPTQPDDGLSADSPMTAADWDKFEADIEEAFEQIP